METIAVEEKLESISEMVVKNSEDITALTFKVDDIRKTLVTKADKSDVMRLEQKVDRLEVKLDWVVNKLS